MCVVGCGGVWWGVRVCVLGVKSRNRYAPLISVSTIQTKRLRRKRFLSNILDDLESRFSQQMLIESFLCAKRQNNTQSWHRSGSHNPAGRKAEM